MKEDSLGRAAVRLSASKIITLIISMLTSMLLSRFRTYEEYGTYSQLLLVINLFTSLLMLGLPNSINYFLAQAETEKDTNRFLSVYYTLSNILCALMGAILVLIIPIIEAYFHNSNIHRFFYFLALYPWASIIFSSVENVLVVLKKTRFLIIYKLIYSLVMLLNVLIVQWIKQGFSTYMILFVATNVAFGVSVFVVISKLCGRLSFTVDKGMVQAIFSFSLPLGLASVVGTLNTEIDKLLIGNWLNTEQLAIYTNAAKELPLTIIATSITAILMPHLTVMIKNKQEKSAVKLWNQATELSFIIIAFTVAAIFVFAEDVITFLYSEKYLPGTAIFRVYTLNLLLRCTYHGIILNSCGETKKIYYCSLISLILNLILNPVFYWIFGMIGPAIATFIAILLVQVLQLVMTSKIVNLPFKDIYPWVNIFKFFLMNIAFSALFFGIKNLLKIFLQIQGFYSMIVLVTIWAGIYFLAVRKRCLLLWHSLNRGGN